MRSNQRRSMRTRSLQKRRRDSAGPSAASTESSSCSSPSAASSTSKRRRLQSGEGDHDCPSPSPTRHPPKRRVTRGRLSKASSSTTRVVDQIDPAEEPNIEFYLPGALHPTLELKRMRTARHQPGTRHAPESLVLAVTEQTDTYCVGRKRNRVSLWLDNPGISRMHAEFRAFTQGGCVVWTVTDTASKGGTYVNDVRLVSGIPHLVKEGDRVMFGCLTAALVAPGQRCPTSRRTMFQYYVKTLKPKPIAVVKGGSLTTEGFRVQLEDREWKGKLMTNDEGQRIVRLDSEMVLENRAEAAKETMVAHFVEMVKREADVAALVGEIAEINSRLLEADTDQQVAESDLEEVGRLQAVVRMHKRHIAELQQIEQMQFTVRRVRALRTRDLLVSEESLPRTPISPDTKVTLQDNAEVPRFVELRVEGNYLIRRTGLRNNRGRTQREECGSADEAQQRLWAIQRMLVLGGLRVLATADEDVTRGPRTQTRLQLRSSKATQRGVKRKRSKKNTAPLVAIWDPNCEAEAKRAVACSSLTQDDNVDVLSETESVAMVPSIPSITGAIVSRVQGLSGAAGVTVTADAVYVTETAGCRVSVYSKSLEYRQVLTKHRLRDPGGVASDAEHLYVADSNCRVAVQKLDGTFCQYVGGAGRLQGMGRLVDVIRDGDTLLVGHSHGLAAYDVATSEQLWSADTGGNGVSEYAGITTDSTHAYIADVGCNCIRVLRKVDGKPERVITGRENGRHSGLLRPTSVAVQGPLLYIAESERKRITVLWKSDAHEVHSISLDSRPFHMQLAGSNLYLTTLEGGVLQLR